MPSRAASSVCSATLKFFNVSTISSDLSGLDLFVLALALTPLLWAGAAAQTAQGTGCGLVLDKPCPNPAAAQTAQGAGCGLGIGKP